MSTPFAKWVEQGNQQQKHNYLSAPFTKHIVNGCWIQKLVYPPHLDQTSLTGDPRRIVYESTTYRKRVLQGYRQHTGLSTPFTKNYYRELTEKAYISTPFTKQVLKGYWQNNLYINHVQQTRLTGLLIFNFLRVLFLYLFSNTQTHYSV